MVVNISTSNLRQSDRSPLKVVFGGHWSSRSDWMVLNETDQDITQRLKFDDDTVDVIFTEHVLEHLDLCDAVRFLTECHRILRPGGFVRIVCPILEKMLCSNLDDRDGRTYTATSLHTSFQREAALLTELGLGGLDASPRLFLLNSLFRLHGHKFIWSSELLRATLSALGYGYAIEWEIGQGTKPEYCIERRCRGLYVGDDWKVDAAMGRIFDAESLAIEGIK